jgi:hypothetical protein
MVSMTLSQGTLVLLASVSSGISQPLMALIAPITLCSIRSIYASLPMGLHVKPR